MKSYNFSLKTDFNSLINSSELHNKISTNENLKNRFLGVCTRDDIISILFDSDINSEDVTNLDDIVKSYNYTEYDEIINHFPIPLEKYKVKYTSYEVIGHYIYRGSMIEEPIKEIKACSYSSSTQTYSIMILDKTNSVIMAEETFDNKDLEINTIKNITNMPLKESIIQVLVKTSNKKYVYVNSVVFYS